MIGTPLAVFVDRLMEVFFEFFRHDYQLLIRDTGFEQFQGLLFASSP